MTAIFKFKKIMTPSLLAAIGIGMVCLLTLFVEPIKGMADNGDFFRVVYSNGMYYLPHYDSNYFGYFVSQYGISNDYNENGSMIFTSQSLIIRLALFINRWFYSHTIFDIRFQAGLYILLLMAGVYLLVEALTYKVRRIPGYILAFLAVFIFGDSAYTEYFNSFYAESLMYVAIIFIVASWLLIYRNRYSRVFLIILYLVSSLFLITSKQQNAPIAVILALMGLMLLIFEKKHFFRYVVLTGSFILFCSGAAEFFLIPDQFAEINQFQAMTRGALLNADHSEQTLADFNINKQYALLRSTTYYQEYSSVSVHSQILRKNFYSKYGFIKISLYYASHFHQFDEMLNTAARDWFKVRPTELGNYQRGANLPFGKRTAYFSLYNAFCSILMPHRFGFIFIWAAVMLGLYLPSFIHAFRFKEERRLLLRLPLILGLLLMEFMATIIAIVGDGDADLAKHLFLFPITFNCLFFILISDSLTGHLFHNHDLRQTDEKVRLPNVAQSHSEVGQ